MKKELLSIALMLFSINLFAVVLPEGTDARINDIQMNDEGTIEKVYLSEPTEINTFLGKMEAVGEVVFNLEGKVVELTPNKDGTAESPIGILNYKGRETIKFYNSGTVSSMTLNRDTVLVVNEREFTCYPSYISFYEEWKPFGFRLSKETKVKLNCGEVICAKGSIINFYSDGTIFNLELGAPAEITSADGIFTAFKNLILTTKEKPILATVLKSDGLNSNYGKIYPKEGSDITFYENGKIEKVVPQDITVIQYEGATFMALANTELGFDEEGVINEATVKGKKLKIFGWDFEFIEDDFHFIIYSGKKIYFPNVILNSINGKIYPYRAHYAEVKRILIDNQTCYYWNRDLDYEKDEDTPGKYSWSYNYAHFNSVFKLSQDDLQEKLVVKIKEGTPSHFTEKGKFDYQNCPLIFDEENNLIGFRKAATKLEKWNDILDRNVDYSNYNRVTDEYENYVQDVLFEGN